MCVSLLHICIQLSCSERRDRRSLSLNVYMQRVNRFEYHKSVWQCPFAGWMRLSGCHEKICLWLFDLMFVLHCIVCTSTDDAHHTQAMERTACWASSCCDSIVLPLKCTYSMVNSFPNGNRVHVYHCNKVRINLKTLASVRRFVH